MPKIDLETLGSGYQSTSNLNNNFQAIEDELNDKVLYRDNPSGEANQMLNDLDMNSNRILNLLPATTNNEPVTYSQLAAASSGITSITTLAEEQNPSSDGQALFTLGISYTPGAKNLSVYRNGVKLPRSSYTETSSSSITLKSPNAVAVKTTDSFEFEVNQRDVDTSTTPASNVIYTPSGSGAVATDVQTRLREIESTDTYAELKALTAPTTSTGIYVHGRSSAGDGGGGNFVFDTSDLSSEVTADTQEGIYVPPSSDPTGASGAWVRQYNGTVKPNWFGAVGDGLTDDTAAIQAAVDFDAKNINFGSKGLEYLISTNIALKSNKDYVGSGATIYQDSIGAEIFAGTDIKNVNITGLKLVGASPDPLITDGTNRAIEIIGAETVNIYDNEIRNFGSAGIFISGASTATIGVKECTVRDNFIYNCTNGIFFYTDGQGNKITGNTIRKLGRAGIFLDDISFSVGGTALQQKDTVVIGNVITDFGNFANGAGITSGWIESVAIHSNIIRDGTGAGISLYAGGLNTGAPIAVKDVSVLGNQVRNVTRQGIVLAGVQYSLIMGNVINSPYVGGTGADAAIDVLEVIHTGGTTYSVQNEICNNLINADAGTVDYGIDITSGCSGNRIHSNKINGVLAVGILDRDGGNEIWRNSGFTTENKGTATILSGNSSIVVNHGLDYAPAAAEISVIPTGSLRGASYFLISGTPNTTSFTIAVNAAVSSDVTFAWSVSRV